MAVNASITEIRDLDDEALVIKLRESKEELFNLRFQSATGQLESHGRLRAVKRDISRIYTIIRERELGIRAIPAPGATLPAKAKKAEKPAAAATEAAAKVATEEVKAKKPAAKKSSKTETQES